QQPRNMTKLRLSFAFLGIYWLGVGLLSPCYSQEATGGADTQRQGFEVSFAPGARDAAGNFMGGTEIRSLVGHAGKLFAGNGYWEDAPGPEGLQGAEILVLDGPDGRWRVDHLEAFIPRYSPVAAGHRMFSIGRGRLEGNAWYLIRSPEGNYDLRRIPARPGQAMVSTRSIAVSPFPTDPDAVYFAGFDANRTRVHNTAWIVRATLATAIGGSD